MSVNKAGSRRKGLLFVARKFPIVQQLIEERLDNRPGGSHGAPPVGARAKALLSAVCALNVANDG